MSRGKHNILYFTPIPLAQQDGQFPVPQYQVSSNGRLAPCKPPPVTSSRSKRASSVRTVVPSRGAFNAHSRCSNVDGCGLRGKDGRNPIGCTTPKSQVIPITSFAPMGCASAHCCDGAEFANGAGVSPMNEVPVNFPLPSKFHVNSADPALAQVGHPLRRG